MHLSKVALTHWPPTRKDPHSAHTVFTSTYYVLGIVLRVAHPNLNQIESLGLKRKTHLLVFSFHQD